MARCCFCCFSGKRSPLLMRTRWMISEQFRGIASTLVARSPHLDYWVYRVDRGRTDSMRGKR